MKNQILQKILSEKKGTRYDVAVMYSGGKDSAYLLHLLKNVYSLHVIAVMVDNGYEYDESFALIKEFPEKLGIPFEIITPPKQAFKDTFTTLIVETKTFRRPGINHVCFACNNILWRQVVKYAEERDIPYVASGLSLEQLSSGREYPLEVNEMSNRIAQKSTSMIFKKNYNIMKKLDRFNNNDQFVQFWDEMANVGKKTTTIYPYIYHNESVEKIKESLVNLGWMPPNKQGVKEYISSGCQVMRKVIYELEKLSLIELNEREQVKEMVKKGLIDEDNLEFANYDSSKDMVNISDEIMKELSIKDYLREECKKQCKKYCE